MFLKARRGTNPGLRNLDHIVPLHQEPQHTADNSQGRVPDSLHHRWDNSIQEDLGLLLYVRAAPFRLITEEHIGRVENVRVANDVEGAETSYDHRQECQGLFWRRVAEDSGQEAFAFGN